MYKTRQQKAQNPTGSFDSPNVVRISYFIPVRMQIAATHPPNEKV